MNLADLTELSPAEHARAIYVQARAEVTDRLWQAAIGAEGDRREREGIGLGRNSGISLSALLVSSKAAPETNYPSPTFAAPDPLPCTVPQPAGGSAAPSPPEFPAAAPGQMALAGLGPNAVYSQLLERAALRSGIPAPAIATIIDAEAARRPDGSWNLLSRNPRSSAAGLGQFLSGTWVGMAEQRGTWLHDLARQNGWLDGHGRVRSGARGELLALRYDATAAIHSVADYAGSNIERMKAAGVAIGRNPAELARAAYLGHQLGPGDAIRFLSNGLDASRAAHLLKAQIGPGRAAEMIAQAGDASGAHRRWLNGYLADNVRLERFTTGKAAQPA